MEGPVEGPVIEIDNENGVFVIRLQEGTEAFQEPQFAEFGKDRPNWEWDADAFSWRVQDSNLDQINGIVRDHFPNAMIRTIPANWEVLAQPS